MSGLAALAGAVGGYLLNNPERKRRALEDQQRTDALKAQIAAEQARAAEEGAQAEYYRGESKHLSAQDAENAPIPLPPDQSKPLGKTLHDQILQWTALANWYRSKGTKEALVQAASLDALVVKLQERAMQEESATKRDKTKFQEQVELRHIPQARIFQPRAARAGRASTGVDQDTVDGATERITRSKYPHVTAEGEAIRAREAGANPRTVEAIRSAGAYAQGKYNIAHPKATDAIPLPPP